MPAPYAAGKRSPSATQAVERLADRDAGNGEIRGEIAFRRQGPLGLKKLGSMTPRSGILKALIKRRPTMHVERANLSRAGSLKRLPLPCTRFHV